MTNIVIVDDHELVREGVKKVLQKHIDLRVVGEARDATTLFDILGERSVHLVVLDISLPGKDGLEVLKDVRIRFPEVKVLVLSMHPEERFAVRSLKAGASGYLTKEVAASELITAIRRIMEGNMYTTVKTTDEMIEELKSNGRSEPYQTLTDREFGVFRLIAAGKTPSQIANQLDLSVNTVNTYRRRIMEKLKMETNAGLIRYALEKGLL